MHIHKNILLGGLLLPLSPDVVHGLDVSALEFQEALLPNSGSMPWLNGVGVGETDTNTSEDSEPTTTPSPPHNSNNIQIFSDECELPSSVLLMLRRDGIVSADCNSAINIMEAIHLACATSPGCRLTGHTDEEESPGDSEEWRAARACAMAQLVLDPVTSAVLHPATDKEAFEVAKRKNWSKDSWLSAQCILQPSTTEETSRIMQIVSHVGARFAIRSGGHNPNPRWASIGPEGVLIDLSKLDRIEVSEAKDSVIIGSGNRWVKVYEALEGSGRSVLGGRTPDVGVGGLLLGCGIPSFSSEYGLACDHVRRYTVVLGNGTVVEADKDVNADLWWALKGGGSNFGIVTEFTLDTLPIDGIWYEARIYAPSENRRLIRAVREYQAAAEEDEKASFAFSLSGNHTIVAFVYSSPVAFPPVFGMFADIPFAGHFIEPSFGTPYTIAKAFEKVLGDRPAFKRDIIAVSTHSDVDLYLESYDRWLETATEAMAQFDCMMTFGIQPVTSKAIEKSNNARGGNPLNLVPISQQWYTSVIQWQDDAHDAQAHAFVKRSGGAVREIALRKGILLDFEFINDATWDQDPLASYGEANVRRLKEVAARYDPGEVFQRLQGAGFLLSRMAS